MYRLFLERNGKTQIAFVRHLSCGSKQTAQVFVVSHNSFRLWLSFISYMNEDCLAIQLKLIIKEWVEIVSQASNSARVIMRFRLSYFNVLKAEVSSSSVQPAR